jgi:hypothetical protein
MIYTFIVNTTKIQSKEVSKTFAKIIKQNGIPMSIWRETNGSYDPTCAKTDCQLVHTVICCQTLYNTRFVFYVRANTAL